MCTMYWNLDYQDLNNLDTSMSWMAIGREKVNAYTNTPYKYSLTLLKRWSSLNIVLVPQACLKIEIWILEQYLWSGYILSIEAVSHKLPHTLL